MAIRHVLSLRKAFQNCDERVAERRGLSSWKSQPDAVSSKLLSNLVVKIPLRLFGSANRAL